MRWLVAIVLFAVVGAPAARSAEAVDVALVLVTDVSRSIDDTEYDLEKRGYATAFADARVLGAIRNGQAGAIAVSYIEFAASFQVKTVIGWTVIRDAASAAAFVAALQAAPRSFRGRTAISSGIEEAMRALAAAPYVAGRRVIDVCGDGTNNDGPDIQETRDRAVAAGITINGLAIINDHPVSWTYAHVQPPGGLDNYYRANVTGGDGSFVLVVHDFASFAEAVTRKLVNEIAGAAPPRRLARGE